MALTTNLKPPWDDASSSCSGSDLAMVMAKTEVLMRKLYQKRGFSWGKSGLAKERKYLINSQERGELGAALNRATTNSDKLKKVRSDL
ncbi:hypothetical protein YC2023_033050 [Brassica napus]